MNNRKIIYETRLRAALPHIQGAREAGLRNATQFAKHLNEQNIPAPTTANWTDDSVHRALRRLKAMGLDAGSRHRVDARMKFPRRTWSVDQLKALEEETTRRLAAKAGK